MLRSTLAARESSAFSSLGRLPLRSRPRYTQQQHDGKKVMDSAALEAVATAPRRRALLDRERQMGRNGAAALLPPDAGVASRRLFGGEDPRGDGRRGARALAARLRERPHHHRDHNDGYGETSDFSVDARAALPDGSAPQPQRQRQRQQQQRLPSAAPSRFADDDDEEGGNLGEQLLRGAEAGHNIILDTPAALFNMMSITEMESQINDATTTTAAAATATSSLVGEFASARAKHAAAQQALAADADDDLVVDPYIEDGVAKHQHPSARGVAVAQDVIDLVTDAFKAKRDAEIAKRRRVLYELTHPDPSDYTYGAKLVPPPPLNFGTVTPEAVRLGEDLMLRQSYSLVNQAGVQADTGTAARATDDSGPSTMIELDVGSSQRRRGQSSSSAVVAPHRSRKRDDNIFRDHNYFFEINELYQEIVMVGKACAGKSSLINALLGQPALANTSSTPNTTRKINFYQSVSPAELRAFHERQHRNQLVKLPGGGLQLTFVDMPGFGIEGMSDKWRDAAVQLTDAYFGVRRSVNTVLFCVDCERGLTKTDVKYFKWLENVQGVFYIVLTKCDSVPHSRVCSVMRQIYVLITKNRKKFRKVFPYIIPVSAKDGTNIDTLRGLITETSGMITGDKLRDLLQSKKAAAMEAGLAAEALRLTQARGLERQQAREQFIAGYRDRLPADSPLLLPRPTAGGCGTGDRATATTAVPPPEVARAASHRTVYELNLAKGTLRESPAGDDGEDGDDGAAPALSASSSSPFGDDGATAGEQERRRRRERFLVWRTVNPLEKTPTPYGSVRYRLNTGLDNPLDNSIRLEYEVASGEGGEADGGGGGDAGEVFDDGPTTAAPPHFPAPVSRVIGLSPAGDADPSAAAGPPPPPQQHHQQGSASASGGGRVSQFLDTLDQFGSRPREEKRLNLARWRRSGASAPALLSEDATGRLAAFQAGRRAGPALAAADSDLTTRQAAFKAQQLRDLLVKENAAAPWDAMRTLGKKLEAGKQQSLLKGMRRKEQAAYLRDAGRVTESFEKFEGEVTMGKYMNETRQAKTLRSQQQMHLNATAKINYRSMPVGLFKQYGQQDSHWPTPRVLGRAEDESHATEYPTTVQQPRRRPSGGGHHRRGGRKQQHHRKQREALDAPPSKTPNHAHIQRYDG